MRRLPTSLAAGIVLVAPWAGCGGEQPETEMEAEPATDVPAEPRPTVRIVEPADGATVGPNVRVVVEVEGIEILPITPPVPGTGHHHFYLDTDVTAWDQVIPSDTPGVVHKGDGSSEHTFQGVAPGPHRIIAVVANPAHIPIAPPIADTVSFTVRN